METRRNFFIMLSVLKGLEQLKKFKFVHHEVKSYNLFLCTNGMVKLGGFNLVEEIDNTKQNDEDELQDSMYKTDIYSLGITIINILKPMFLKAEKRFIHEYFTNIMKIENPELYSVVELMLKENPM